MSPSLIPVPPVAVCPSSTTKSGAICCVCGGNLHGVTNTDVEETKFNDFTLSVSLDNKGDFKTLDLKFSSDITSGMETASVDYTVKMNVIQIGGVVVNFPADLDEYELFDLKFDFDIDSGF